MATGRPGSTWWSSSFLTAPYAVRPPHTSGASSSPSAVGQRDQRLGVHREVLGERAHDRLVLRAEARAARSGTRGTHRTSTRRRRRRGRGSPGRRPTRRRRRPGPSASTMPIASWPSTPTRRCRTSRHAARCRSEWQMPAALMWISASSNPGSGIGTSRMWSVAVLESCCLHGRSFSTGRGSAGSCHPPGGTRPSAPDRAHLGDLVLQDLGLQDGHRVGVGRPVHPGAPGGARGVPCSPTARTGTPAPARADRRSSRSGGSRLPHATRACRPPCRR